MAELESAFDVVVVGAGPAGIAAAATAAERGARVAVIDERPQAGGQIWQRDRMAMPTTATAATTTPTQTLWMDRLQRAGAARLYATSVWDVSVSESTGFTLRTSRGNLYARKVVLACGARELFLPFPGWTLPGVTGAGALQALVHDGLDVAGQRIVVAGTGPLLLQVAAALQARGAEVVRIAEQTTLTQLLHFGLALAPHKMRQAMSLFHPRYRTSQWVVRAEGTKAVETVTLRRPRGNETVRCDRLAIGYGLVPNLELAQRFGCTFDARGVIVDDQQATSVAHVFAAGEVCGIKGAPGALAEGVCAGNAAGETSAPEAARWQRRRERQFARHLQASFALRHELLHLAAEETLVCRCEDVAYAELRDFADWTTAKMQTRCGMGACQGRICGTATQHLFGWGPQAVRPPLVPVPIAQLLTEGNVH